MEKKVLPAHAGVILKKACDFGLIFCTSRTCGGDPEKLKKETHRKEYFPHMRG